jgi:hypothetical protein
VVTVEAVSWLTEPDSEWDSPDQGHLRDPGDEPKGKVRLVALVLGGWLAVSLVVLVLLLAFGGHHSAAKQSNPPLSTSPTAGAGAGAAAPLPDGWVQEAADDQSNCAAHSYGQVTAFFAKTPCTTVRRVLATTNQGGRTIVIASNVVTFDTAAQAQRYLALVNADGTGNISDLLREGISFPGGPSRLPAAAFASRQAGSTVHVAEAAFVAGPSSGSDPTLLAIARLGVR